MKEFIKKMLLKFKSWFISSEEWAKRVTTVAIKITNIVKTIVDSPVDDVVAELLKKAIPGKADDVVIDAALAGLKTALPKIVSELTIVDGLLDGSTVEEKAAYVLGKIKFSSDEQKNEFAHNLCTKLVQFLSDGKLTFGEAAVLSEMVYQELKQNNQL